MLFDLGKFKKISSDKKTTTLKHPDGHTITVSHDSLSPKMRGQLASLDNHSVALKEPKAKAPDGKQDSALSKMGEQPVEALANGGGAQCPQPDGTIRDCTPDDILKRTNTSDWSKNKTVPNTASDPANNPDAKKFEQGAGFADGGVADPTADLPASSVQTDDPTATLPDDGTGPTIQDPRTPDQMNADAQATAKQMIPGADLIKNAPATAGMPRPQATPTDAAAPQGDGQRQPAGSNPAMSFAGAAQTAMGGINQEIAGKQAEGKALGQQADAAVPILSAQQQADQKVQSDFQAAHAHLDDVNAQLSQQIAENKIDPDNYFKKMSTGGHIATGIGLILGGMGAGRGPNQALGYVQNAIDRDIDAQKTDLGNKKTLLEANMRQYGNLNAATEVTRLQNLTMFQHQLDASAAKYNNPLVTARAQQAIGELQQKKADIQKQAAMTMTLAGAQKSGDPEQTIAAMRYMNPEMAKEMESRYVPGVGMASIPLSETARSGLIATKDFDNQMRNLISWTKQHSGEVKAIDPSDVNTGRAMAQAAQNSYRTAQQMGVYKASEAPLLEGEIPQDPTAFLNKFRVLPQYNAVLQNNQRKMQTMGQAYGLKIPGAAALTPQAPKLKK